MQWFLWPDQIQSIRCVFASAALAARGKENAGDEQQEAGRLQAGESLPEQEESEGRADYRFAQGDHGHEGG
jgi:hypothetical protein